MIFNDQNKSNYLENNDQIVWHNLINGHYNNISKVYNSENNDSVPEKLLFVRASDTRI